MQNQTNSWFHTTEFFVLLWGTDEMSFLIWYMLNGDRKRDFLLCHNLKLKQVFSGIIFRVAIANGISWGNKKKKKAKICKINLKSRFLPFVICLCGFLSGVLYFRQPVKWFPLYLHPAGGFCTFCWTWNKHFSERWSPSFLRGLTYYFQYHIMMMRSILWNDTNKWTLAHILLKWHPFCNSYINNKHIYSQRKAPDFI